MDMVFIINPVAGKGKAKKVIPMIEEYMGQQNKKYEIWMTKKPKEGTELAIKAKEKKVKKVIAVGGDGTISEVVNGLALAIDIELGIIPAGTGNDLCRTLRIPMDLKKALSLAIEEKARAMDLGKVGTHYFMNVASIGLDAEIAQWTNKAKRWVPSGLAYIVSVFKNLITYQYKRRKISLGDKQFEEEVLLMAIGNGKYYGGGMKVTPGAKVDDGIFDICMVQKLSKWKIGILFPTIFKGSHIYIKGVNVYQAGQIMVETKEDITVNVDGEILTMKPPIVFSIQPKALKVIYPKSE